MSTVTLYQGDCREILPTFPSASVDCCIADPNYVETSLPWDKRCDGWIPALARVLKPASSIWVFGSLRSLVPVFAEMAEHGFTYSQEIVWEKQNGSCFHADRFRRVHELVVLFYRGQWRDVYHDPQYDVGSARRRVIRRKMRPTHHGLRNNIPYVSEDGGDRLMRSVLQIRNEHGRAIHPTQKPVELVLPLLRYSCPPGGTALDCFAGSGTTGVAARIEHRDAILIEKDPTHAAVLRQRLANDAPLFTPPVRMEAM